MKNLFTVLLFAQLSLQLPSPRRNSNQRHRSHKYSPHRASLRRGHFHGRKGHKHGSGSQSGAVSDSGTVVDNQRVRYLMPITVGSQTLEAEIDTGSSDLWLIQRGFNCYSSFDQSSFQWMNQQTRDTCNFGPPFQPDSSFKQIADVHEFSCYGGGERCVAGPLGHAPVSFCGLKIQQTVGAPLNSSYQCSGQAQQSGIIGLAFSSLTMEYTSSGDQETYPSIMETIFKSNPSMPSYFSLAMSRDASGQGNGGLFTIGGTPQFGDPAVNISSDSYTSAPLLNDDSGYMSFYIINVDGFATAQANTTTNNSTSSSNVTRKAVRDAGTEVIIDSGAPGMWVPQNVADAVNSNWSPALADDGSTVDCNAKLKQPFGVTIGGVTYYMQAADLMNPNGDGTCSTAVYGVDGQYLLGDPLLKNVLAIYDWGNSQMAFYPRMYYQS